MKVFSQLLYSSSLHLFHSVVTITSAGMVWSCSWLGLLDIPLIIKWVLAMCPTKMSLKGTSESGKHLTWEWLRVQAIKKKTTLTSLSILFVIIWVLVGVKTSVLVWQGVGSVACAKGKKWRGLKAVQYFGMVFALKNTRLAALSTRDFVLGSVLIVSLSLHSPSAMACAPTGPPQERTEGGYRRCRVGWSPQSYRA